MLILIHTSINDVELLTSPKNTKLTIIIDKKLDIERINY